METRGKSSQIHDALQRLIIRQRLPARLCVFRLSVMELRVNEAEEDAAIRVADGNGNGVGRGRT